MTEPLLPLPIRPEVALRRIILPALKLLPSAMGSERAAVLILAIFLQESNLANRWQVIDLARPQVKGPARGLSQFERGTRASRGGVWGIYLHQASRYWLAHVCGLLGVTFHPDAIWKALDTSDTLAACCARVLLFTDPKPLPPLGDTEAAWQYYLRNWRPGAAKRQYAELRAKWTRKYALAVAALK